MKRTKYTDWMIRLKHAFIAAGYFKYNARICHLAFKPLYEMGLTPIEAVLLDLEEGGE